MTLNKVTITPMFEGALMCDNAFESADVTMCTGVIGRVGITLSEESARDVCIFVACDFKRKELFNFTNFILFANSLNINVNVNVVNKVKKLNCFRFRFKFEFKSDFIF